MDIAALIERFNPIDIPLTRRASAPTVKGRAVAGGTTPLTIRGLVHPASGRDLQRLPEERRATETKVVYTSTQLLVGGEADNNEADLLTIEGKSWEVENVESWPGMPGGFRCMAQVTG